MSWLAVDKDGAEMIYEEMPIRGKGKNCDIWIPDIYTDDCITLPKG